MLRVSRNPLTPLENSRTNLLKTVLQRNHQKVHGVRLPNSKRKILKETKKKRLDRMLKEAINSGNFQRAEILIREGADVNNPGRTSPLHLAAQFNHHKILKRLIEEGADVNSSITGPREPYGVKVTGITPLHLAALKNNLKCAKILLKRGANVCPKTEAACHPIHMAVCKDYEEMVGLLLDYGVDANLPFPNSFFQEFLKTMPENLWRDHALPLLHMAILKKSKKMIQLLLERGADVNIKTNLGRTTLMQAIEVNDEELVQFLISKGVDVNERDVFGKTALHCTMINANREASMYSKVEHGFFEVKLKIVDHLMNAGADVNAQFPSDEDQTSVIHYMVKFGFDLGVSYFLNQSDLNINGIDYKTVRLAEFLEENLTPDIEDDLNYILNLKGRFSMIRKYLVQWAVRRQLIGFSVDKKILEGPINQWTVEDHNNAINSIRSCTLSQINYMMQTKIGGSDTTFWNLITCDLDELGKLMSDGSTKLFEYFDVITKNKSNMTHFSQMLLNRICVAERRRTGLKPLEFISYLLIDQLLPEYCCDRNFSF